MDVATIKEQLAKGIVQPIYIFTGEEVGIMDIYLAKIGEVMGIAPKRANALSDIYSRLRNQTFGNQKNLYVIRDDKEYLSQEKIWAEVNTGKAQGQNVIILIYTNLDKRGKFYKQHTDSLVVFEKLIPELLAKYIKREIGLEVNLGTQLAEMCGCDYSRILLECDKIKHLSNVTKMDIGTTFRHAVANKLIHVPSKDVIFEFVDAVCRRQIGKSYALMRELEEVTDSSLGALSLLYTNMRGMLLVQGLGNEANPSEKTGLTPWQVKLAKEKMGKYAISELVDGLMTLRWVEKGIKTGAIDATIALDYALVRIL